MLNVDLEEKTMADERTYVRISKALLKERENRWSAFDERNVEELLLVYAKKQPIGSGLIKDGKICRHKTIKHLVRATNSYLKTLKTHLDREDMSLQTSTRQVKKLLSSLKSNKKLCLTGFSLIILDFLLNKDDDHIQTVNAMGSSVVDICRIYIKEFNDNIVPEYIVKCESTFYESINKQNTKPYPSIPRTEIPINRCGK